MNSRGYSLTPHLSLLTSYLMLLASNSLASHFVLQILNLPPKIRAFFQTSRYLVEKMPVFWYTVKWFIINVLCFNSICRYDEKPCFYVQKATFWAFITYKVSTRNIHSYAHNSYSYARNMLCYDEKHGFLAVLTYFSVLSILFRKKLPTIFCRNNSEFSNFNFQSLILKSLDYFWTVTISWQYIWEMP